MADTIIIYPIETDNQIDCSVPVLREAFGTVAETFHLTEANAPTNAAFINAEAQALKEMRAKGIEMFGMSEGERQIGFVALEWASSEVCYIEKLAVLPRFRHRGYGTRLMDYCFDQIKGSSVERVSIGIINENTLSTYLKHPGATRQCWSCGKEVTIPSENKLVVQRVRTPSDQS